MKKFTAICVAAVQSGVGKTTLTLGLLSALVRRGLTVQPFKCGPDYIDSGYHGGACGRVSRNLDPWLMGEEAVRDSFCRNVSGADVAVIEGVMGLFDGAEGDATVVCYRNDVKQNDQESEFRQNEQNVHNYSPNFVNSVRNIASGSAGLGTTAQVSVITGVPVLLLINGKGLAQSAAAMVKGYCELRKDVRIVGVIANNVNSAKHRRMIADSLSAAGLPPLMGVLPRDAGIAIPERHLGLVPGNENLLNEAWYSHLADVIEKNVDVDSVLDRFTCKRPAVPSSGAARDNDVVRVGLARDEAFHFYYEDNLDMLKEAGVELVEFSPIKDAKLPDGVSGLYIGGGFPEMFADRLSANTAMRSAISEFSRTGGRIYAECGGLMYLCRDLKGFKGEKLEMCGVIPASTVMEGKVRQIGYRKAVLVADGPFGVKGVELRGHEFHWSRTESGDSKADVAYSLRNSRNEDAGTEGFSIKNVFASYVHIHFASSPGVVVAFKQWMRGAVS